MDRKTENCQNKDRYETYEEAKAALVYLDYPLDIYKCDVCGGYHFTSKKGN
jgi:hypothetical protein